MRTPAGPIRERGVVSMLGAMAVTALLACASTVGALAQDALYAASVPVADTSDEARAAALPEALVQVVSKLAGTDAGVRERLAAVPGDVSALIEQYRYRDPLRVPDLDPSGNSIAAPARAGRRLWVRFDRDAVDALMSGAGITPYRGERPSVLVWMVRETPGGEPDLLAAGADPALEWFDDAAWRRGVELEHPLLDLEDRIAIRPQQVVEVDIEALRAASRRYGPGPILAVRLADAAGGAARAYFALIDGEETLAWQAEGDDAVSVLERGATEHARRILARYSLANAPRETVEIVVAGVATVSDYGRLLTYLNGLDGVRDVRVVRTERDALALRLEMAGGIEKLRRRVSLEGVLRAEEAATRFRLLP